MAGYHLPALRAYLERVGVREREGDEVYTLCPLCRHPNQKLHINLKEGLWHCFHCQGEIMPSMFEASPNTPSLAPGVPQEPRSYPKVSLTMPWVESCHKALFTQEGRQALQYLLDRGLSPPIIKYFKLGYTSESNAVVIPNFGKTKVYSVTLRLLDPTASPKYLAFGPRFLFNSRYLSHKTKSCVVFEGELNCISSVQLFPKLTAFALGGKAHKSSQSLQLLGRYQKVYLFLDADAEEESKKLSELLGPYKCYKVSLKDFKDLNDALKAHKADPEEAKKIYATALKLAEPYREPILQTPQDLVPQVVKAYLGREPVLSTGHAVLDGITGGIRGGELTLLTGVTGVGKSTLAFELAINMMRQGIKSYIASFELSTVREVIPKLLSLMIHKNIEIDRYSEQALLSLLTVFSKAPFLFLNCHGITPLPELFYSMTVAYDQQCTFFVLDHLHYFIPPDDTMAQRGDEDRFMIALKAWLNDHPKASVLLIAHHRKPGTSMRTGEPFPISLHDIKGSSRITQDSDNVWVINQSGTSGILSVEKLRSSAITTTKGGKAVIRFDQPTSTMTISTL
jgi:energy-coupling factor transporter ATP-binding protein EcfA2/5S rRNA maturation endonuclease (ribonuclease M5)